MALTPGVTFETYAPEGGIPVERTDIAVFIGFAEKGPVHIPVAIGDTARFAAIFGGECPLPWKASDGSPCTAYLAPTVEAFFRNGGRACRVIRVAGENAGENVFALPCMLEARIDAGGGYAVQPAFVKARSAGDWSDSLFVNVATSMNRFHGTLSFPETDRSRGYGMEMALRGDCAVKPVAGDCLRIVEAGAPDGEQAVLFTVIDTVRNSTHDESAYVVTAGDGLWFRQIGGLPESVPTPPQITVWSHTPRTYTALSPLTQADDTAGTGSAFLCDIVVPPGSAVPSGSVCRVNIDYREFWCIVLESALPPHAGAENILTVHISSLWERIEHSCDGNVSFAGTAVIADLLRIDIAVSTKNGLVRSGELGLGARHPSAWSGLKDDAARFDPYGTSPTGDAHADFPCAALGRYRDGDFAFPISLFSSDFLSGPTEDSARRIDKAGLSRFDTRLFIDERLQNESERTLAARADFIAFRQYPAPQPLFGMHAAYYLEEAALIAVPDAVHHGPEDAIEWVDTWYVEPPAESPCGTVTTARGDFRCCEPPPEAPRLDATIDTVGSAVRLSWTPHDPSCTYTLQRSSSRFFVPVCITVAEGITAQEWSDSLDLIIRTAYFRIRAHRKNRSSDWSEPVAVSRKTVAKYRPDENFGVLREVHRALLCMCAVRGDMFAVLSLPARFGLEEAAAWISSLRERFGGFTEASNTLSFGALHHPWILQSDGAGTNRLIPPDGALCGITAKRTLRSGPWSAPANEPLHNAVALHPHIPEPWYPRFIESGVNCIVQNARGCMPLTSMTLSRDPEFDQVHVRRLLILLRRMALKHGTAYVFEPGNDSFRRMVERGFEEVLMKLFQRGAFAGRTPESSFRVDVDTKASLADQGLFIVEIRIAPSAPMRFITIRLVQGGERIGIEEGRG